MKIVKICEEIVGIYGEVNVFDEKDLMFERLNDYYGQLEVFQKEKVVSLIYRIFVIDILVFEVCCFS